MTKRYLPPGCPCPIYNSQDIRYIRFVKDGKTIKVAKNDPENGELILVLYPTENPDKFEGEGFHDVDDRSKRRVLERADISDEVLLDLAAGKEILKIQSRYPFEMLGAHPSGSYKFDKGKDSRTFFIEETEIPAS
jgi:hypothetical protein